MNDYKFSKEVAEEQLNKFLKWYDICEEDMEDEESKSIINKCSSKIIKAIRKGLLTISDEGETLEVKQITLKTEQEIPYSELEGKHKVATDKEKKEYAKMYSFLGSITGIGTQGIKSLKGVDLSLAESIAALLFLA